MNRGVRELSWLRTLRTVAALRSRAPRRNLTPSALCSSSGPPDVTDTSSGIPELAYEHGQDCVCSNDLLQHSSADVYKHDTKYCVHNGISYPGGSPPLASLHDILYRGVQSGMFPYVNYTTNFLIVQGET